MPPCAEYDFVKNGTDIRITWNQYTLRPGHHDIPRKIFEVIREDYMVDAFKKWLQGETIPDHTSMFMKTGTDNYSFTRHFQDTSQHFFIEFGRKSPEERIIIFAEFLEHTNKIRTWTVSVECYNQMLAIPNLDDLLDLADMN
jgi:hypothetical protein